MDRFSRRVPRDLGPNRLSEARTQRGEVPFDLTPSNPTVCDFPYPADLLAPLSDPRGLGYRPAAFGPAPSRAAVALGVVRRIFVVSPQEVVGSLD